MKIVWIDDEINVLDMGVKTLQLLGHDVVTFRTSSEFLDWLDSADGSAADVFLVDLMMSSGDGRLAAIESKYAANVDKSLDKGTLIALAIRDKFSEKPIIALTIVTEPDLRVFANDEHFEYVLKTGTIEAVLEIANKMQEK